MRRIRTRVERSTPSVVQVVIEERRWYGWDFLALGEAYSMDTSVSRQDLLRRALDNAWEERSRLLQFDADVRDTQVETDAYLEGLRAGHPHNDLLQETIAQVKADRAGRAEEPRMSLFDRLFRRRYQPARGVCGDTPGEFRVDGTPPSCDLPRGHAWLHSGVAAGVRMQWSEVKDGGGRSLRVGGV